MLLQGLQEVVAVELRGPEELGLQEVELAVELVVVLEKMKRFPSRTLQPTVTLRKGPHLESGCELSQGFIMEWIIVMAYQQCQWTSMVCSTKCLFHLLPTRLLIFTQC